MKKALLFITAALAMTACNYYNYDDRIDMSQLAGTWVRFNNDPQLDIDGSVTYSFDGEGGYWMFVHDALANTVVPHRGTYEITGIEGSKRITLHDGDDGKCDGQYFFLQLSSRNMKWMEVLYGAKPRVERFERVPLNVLPKLHDNAAMFAGVWDGRCERILVDGSKHTEGVRLTLNEGKYLCRSTTNDALAVGTGEYMVLGNKFVFRTANANDALHDLWRSEPLLLDGEATFTLQDGILTFGAKKGGEYYVYRLSRYIEGIE